MQTVSAAVAVVERAASLMCVAVDVAVAAVVVVISSFAGKCVAVVFVVGDPELRAE